jgi:hypothetical protein
MGCSSYRGGAVMKNNLKKVVEKCEKELVRVEKLSDKNIGMRVWAENNSYRAGIRFVLRKLGRLS